ncbi:MAG: hypothetical protein KF903_14075 [Dokdonella sp.]|uniref:hypothetical protein n=1 Tax=Dokdonella sp. TaxID=2291710 RepID=UPI0025C65860|nr:hypothetical protein [Dokdonella sp.]MBX3702115.1 hypothetical protein [Dokdonella sp.]
MPRVFALCLLVCSCLLAPAASAAAQETSGQMASGAWYRIAVPAGWSAGDTLILYQHGFDFSAPDGPPGLGPLKDVALAQGYAIAASSYRERGWAMFDAIDDNRDLVARFTQQFGAPGHMLPFGGSLGGLVALKLAEADGFPPVQGVFAMCPAAAGSRLWDYAIDLRLGYAAICEGAGELRHGAQPLWWAFDLAMIPAQLGDLSGLGGMLDNLVVLDTLLQVNRCTGINLPPAQRSADKQRRLAELMAYAHLSDEQFLLTNIGYATFGLADIVRAPDKLAGLNPFTTAGVDYGDDPLVAARITRLIADPVAAQALRAASDFHGQVGAAKIMSLHTSRDELVIPANQEFIRNQVPSTQWVSAIVAEDEPSHCGFNVAEGLAGWEALRAWINGAPQPSVAQLQQACQTLVASGVAAGPCRFDPAASFASFDSIVRPRTAATATARGHSTHRSAPRPPAQAAPRRRALNP